MKRAVSALIVILCLSNLVCPAFLYAATTLPAQVAKESQPVTATPPGISITPTSQEALNVTYAELMSLRSSSSFVPNQWYRITDFRTRWYSKETERVFEGPVEPLLVQAVSKKVLALRAYSEKHPEDEIDYIIYDGSLHGEMRNDVEVPSNDRGGIVRRKDILRSIECWFDFRAYTVRLFETKPGNGIFRHNGAGPAYEDRNLFDIDRSTQVIIKRAVIQWRNEDGSTDFIKGAGNPEHYLGACDKVQIGLSSWRIRVYGPLMTNGIFGDCTDDITVEGAWNNSQMLGFNAFARFGADVNTSFFLGGVENLNIEGKVSRSTFLPGICGVTFKGSVSDSVVFPHAFRNTGYSYDTDKSNEIIGAAPAALHALEDAPHDGNMYARQNGKWVRLPQKRK